MLKFRWCNKIYADILGYFWLPCPICHQMFGGHEATRHTINDRMVCPDCINDKRVRR
jgi:formylmethanofuran dehydrogenase subunit E